MKLVTSTRRKFLKTAVTTAGVATFRGLIPSSVLGANDRITFGVIGLGGMGTSHMKMLMERAAEDNIKIVAVCDVYQRRLTKAMNFCSCKGYLDYRTLYDRKDIDAVVIATPDHWHAKLSIDAMAAGKHVYVEKPMTNTIEQALEVRNAVRRYKKVLQVGPQGTSEAQFWNAQKAIKQGRVGKVTWAQGGYSRNTPGGLSAGFVIDETAGPHFTGEDYIDWDMWLGHKWGLAPKIPWNPEHFFRFRKYWPYSGGLATDLLYHKLAPLLLAIVGENGEYPYRVNGNGGLYIEKDGRDIPDVCTIVIDYPSEFTVNLACLLTNDTSLQTRILGRYGTIELNGDAVMTGNGAFVRHFEERNDGYNHQHKLITE